MPLSSAFGPAHARLSIIHVTGKASTKYVANEFPLPVYLALHLALTKWRLSAVVPKHFGPPVQITDLLYKTEELSTSQEHPEPRVMTIGPRCSSQTTLLKTLANWAVKSGQTKVKGPGLCL